MKENSNYIVDVRPIPDLEEVVCRVVLYRGRFGTILTGRATKQSQFVCEKTTYMYRLCVNFPLCMASMWCCQLIK